MWQVLTDGQKKKLVTSNDRLREYNLIGKMHRLSTPYSSLVNSSTTLDHLFGDTRESNPNGVTKITFLLQSRYSHCPPIQNQVWLDTNFKKCSRKWLKNVNGRWVILLYTNISFIVKCEWNVIKKMRHLLVDNGNNNFHLRRLQEWLGKGLNLW